MATVASESYVSIPRAALILGIGEWRIRYWQEKDKANFPYGLRAGKIVVKPSAVAEYFRRMDEVQEVTGELGNDDEDSAEE